MTRLPPLLTIEAGIDHLHLRPLGTPKDGRDAGHCHRILVAEMIVGESGQTVRHLPASRILSEPVR